MAPSPNDPRAAKALIHSLDGKLLHLFLSVYECSSVSVAADRLGLTQSTVSHGLDRLRKALGDPLFVRDGRNITPTAHADYLAPRVREALTLLEALADSPSYTPAQDRALITIAAHWDELEPELGAITRAIWAEAPMMPIRALALGAVSNTRAMLDSGEADLVLKVRVGEPIIDIDTQPLLTDRKVIFFDPNCRGPVTTLDDYVAARHAVLDFGGVRSSLLDLRLGDLKIERQIQAYASTLFSLARMMRGTDMITTMQSRFHGSSFPDFAQCEVPFTMTGVAYDMCWHHRQSQSQRLAWVRKKITAAVRGVKRSPNPMAQDPAFQLKAGPSVPRR